MARARNTYAKRQREQDKKERADRKRERRDQRKRTGQPLAAAEEQSETESQPPDPAV